MTRKFTARTSTAASVRISDGQAIISLHGRVSRIDAPDAVSVTLVSNDSGSYLEITDRQGKTRRVDAW